jgi:hypothetical protein
LTRKERDELILKAQQEALKAQQEALKAQQEALKAQQEALKAQQEALKAQQEAPARGQAVPADWPARVYIVRDARIPPPVARELRQAEEQDLFRTLASLDTGAWKVRDFTLSAGDGFVVDNPELPQIAIRKTGSSALRPAHEVYALLGGEPRWADRALPLIPGEPGLPDTPVRVCIVWDARIPPPVVRGLGQAERDLFRALMSRGPGVRKVPDVQRANFTLSTGDGFVVNSPALRDIAVGKTADAINLLLVWPLRYSDPFPPVEPLYPTQGPYRRPRPFDR